MEGPRQRRGPTGRGRSLTFSANLVPKEAACSAGTAPTPQAASAASTAALVAPQESRAQARLRDDERILRLVVSDMPKRPLTSALDAPEAHAASTARTNPSEWAL